jgi:glutaredoxin-related protein
MFERPILFYSNYCNYSNLFIEQLAQLEPLYDSFIRINIDIDPQTKQRPKVFYEIQQVLQFKISDVPTIIVQNGEFILSGKEAFNWLEYQIKEISKQIENHQAQSKELHPESLEAFNPLEMGAFSDGYATIDDSAPKSQSFQFLNSPMQSIRTPEENGQNIDKNSNDYSSFLQNRNNIDNKTKYQSSSQRPVSRQSHNDNNSKNSKSHEVDKKYEQLLAEREMMFNKKQPKRVNFADGTF